MCGRHHKCTAEDREHLKSSDGGSEWIKYIIFSAPGRTGIGGNYTDHQHGCVIAAAVDMTTTAEVTLNGTNVIRVDSEGGEAG